MIYTYICMYISFSLYIYIFMYVGLGLARICLIVRKCRGLLPHKPRGGRTYIHVYIYTNTHIYTYIVMEIPPVSPGIPSVSPRPLSGIHIPLSGAPGRTGELHAIPSHACAFR